MRQMDQKVSSWISRDLLIKYAVDFCLHLKTKVKVEVNEVMPVLFLICSFPSLFQKCIPVELTWAAVTLVFKASQIVSKVALIFNKYAMLFVLQYLSKVHKRVSEVTWSLRIDILLKIVIIF